MSAQALSKLRWYLALVGLFGIISQASMLDTPGTTAATRLLAWLGLPVFMGYLGCALLFERAGRTGVLLGVLGAALAWMLAVGANMFISGSTQLAVPLGLFLILPCVFAIMQAWDWRAVLARR